MIIEKEVKKFGAGSAHVIVPANLIGKKVQVLFEEQSSFITKIEARKMIEEAIQEVKSGY
jgi:hypothetical protein